MKKKRICILIFFALCVLNIKYCEELVSAKSELKESLAGWFRYSGDLSCISGKIKQSGFWNEENLIAHAGGGINGFTYTNSLESIERSAEIYDHIEIDLLCTSDDRFVLCHQWEDDALSYDEFMTSKVFDFFTPLDLEGLIRIVMEKDIKFILDVRFSDDRQKKVFISELKKYCSDLYLKNSIAIIINDISFFKDMGGEIDTNWIYRIKNNDKISDVISMCIEDDIEAVCIAPSYINDLEQLNYFADHDIECLLYKTNDINEALAFWNFGSRGIFTDYITEEDFKELTSLSY